MNSKILTFAILFLCSMVNPIQAADKEMAVKRIEHKAAIKKDAVTSGTFSYTKGGDMSMVFTPEDKLLMEGTKYTMVMGKRQSVARGETALLFGVMQRVVDAIMQGKEAEAVRTKTEGVIVEQKENTITISPDTSIKPNRLLFTSFVIRFDARKHTLLSIRMNGRGKDNYTTYEF